MSYVQDSIGPYRLLTLLRAGAHCQVWEGLKAGESKRCAVKAMTSEYRRNRAQIAGLKLEYEIGSKLESPRVVRAFDFGVEDGIGYIAMELFSAPNIKQMLQTLRSDPSAVDAAEAYPRIVEEGAEGLAYLHSQGWLHRDVKPHNFLVSPAGETKLIDFSLAQKIKRGLGRLFGRSKTIQGTRSYMSPEQIRGKTLDPRADVYSFACTVFELFAGRPPFTGASANDLLVKHLRSPVPALGAYNKDVSPEFADLVQRSMAKVPAERPQSMDQFLEQLRQVSVFKAAKAVGGR